MKLYFTPKTCALACYRTSGLQVTSAAPATGGSECDRLWQQYRDSQECFAPFMMGSGGIKAEAFEKCKEVRSPAQQCGPMR